MRLISRLLSLLHIREPPQTRQAAGNDNNSVSDMSTADDSVAMNRRRKENRERQNIKAKKAKRKPLPAKIQQKRKEKKELRKHQPKKERKDECRVEEVEGQLFLRRRPIPDDPTYETVCRKLIEEVPPDADQDVQDAAYVNAIANELNYMTADEIQMMPRYERVSSSDYRRMKSERYPAFFGIVKAYNQWSLINERFKTPQMTDMMLVIEDNCNQLPVPWIGMDNEAPLRPNSSAPPQKKKKKKMTFGMSKKDGKSKKEKKREKTVAISEILDDEDQEELPAERSVYK